MKKMSLKKIMMRGTIVALSVALMLGTVVGCGSSQSADADKKGPTIKVASKTFTEELILGSLMVQYLEGLGYPVENKTGLGETAVIRPALTSGQINAYWEYTGTGVLDFMHHDPVFDEKESYKLIKEWDAKNGIAWLDYAPLNDTYGIAARPDIVEKYNLKTTSDLVNFIKNGGHLTLVSFAEWDERVDNLPQFQKVYDFVYPKKDILDVAMGLGYDALKAKKGDLTVAFTTDARIASDGLIVLEDDKKAFPVYNATPVFRQDIIDAYPEIPAQMKKLSDLLDNKTMTTLNSEVDVQKKSVDEVAKQFLMDNGLLK